MRQSPNPFFFLFHPFACDAAHRCVLQPLNGVHDLVCLTPECVFLCVFVCSPCKTAFSGKRPHNEWPLTFQPSGWWLALSVWASRCMHLWRRLRQLVGELRHSLEILFAFRLSASLFVFPSLFLLPADFTFTPCPVSLSLFENIAKVND